MKLPCSYSVISAANLISTKHSLEKNPKNVIVGYCNFLYNFYEFWLCILSLQEKLPRATKRQTPGRQKKTRSPYFTQRRQTHFVAIDRIRGPRK